MFTFLTISYNQEKFIIEHLESIKYQIKNFGNNEEFKYILSDDCSKDSTVFLVKKWIQINSDLFKEVKILTNDENKGIVDNYLRGIGAVNTLNFKGLAGDDLIYKNNIFEAITNFDLVFTPLIRFNEKEIKGCITINHLLPYRKQEYLRELIKLDNCFNAPGSFISQELVQDNELRNFISKYKWIEDLPQWYYLLTYRDDIKIGIKETPYILYRTASGISSNKKHRKHDMFDNERNEIRKQLDLKLYRYPKYINPFKYYAKFLNLKLEYYDNKFNKEVIKANKIMEKEISQAPEYLNYIRIKAYEFYKSIGREELYGQPIIINKN